MDNNLLKMEGILKNFGGVQALKGVDFDLNAGEIVGLVGENGAGKSTLMSVASGIYPPSQGAIYIKGEKVQIANPAVARNLGIEMVHQEPALAPNLSATANLFLGRERLNNKIFLSARDMTLEANRILREIGIAFDPEKKVIELSMAEKEAVSIARAMGQRPKILILDEVTAPLDQDETEQLFEVIRKLKATGIGIIFIGHRLREIFEIADRIVVLRDGRLVGTIDTREGTQEQVIKLMVGESALNEQQIVQSGKNQNQVLLRCRNLSCGKNLQKVNLELRSCEILGLAGLKGSGRREWAKALFGLSKIDQGDIYRNGSKISIRTPLEAIRAGIGYIPRDRQGEGLAMIKAVEENINITMLDRFSHLLGILSFKKLGQNANKLKKDLQIKTPTLGQLVMNLSGGNQQKVMIGKWLARDLDIFIFDEPTRGVDVGAKSEIHRLLGELKKQGKAIVVISSEIPEILRVSDRIVTMSQGEIGAEFSRSEATEEKIMQYLHAEISNLSID